jgi:hypothetical protein
VLALSGCLSVDKHFETLMVQVIKPTAEKIIAENPVADAVVEGDVQGVEPGYVARFRGVFGTVIEGEVEIYARGVSGKLLGRAEFAVTQPSGGP